MEGRPQKIDERRVLGRRGFLATMSGVACALTAAGFLKETASAQTPEIYDPNQTHILTITTDGHENHSEGELLLRNTDTGVLYNLSSEWVIPGEVVNAAFGPDATSVAVVSRLYTDDRNTPTYALSYIALETNERLYVGEFTGQGTNTPPSVFPDPDNGLLYWTNGSSLYSTTLNESGNTVHIINLGEDTITSIYPIWSDGFEIAIGNEYVYRIDSLNDFSIPTREGRGSGSPAYLGPRYETAVPVFRSGGDTGIVLGGTGLGNNIRVWDETLPPSNLYWNRPTWTR